LPAWAPPETAGHFLKYADEQTVAAVAAVDRAVQSGRIDLSQNRDWAIIAAPRFLGRVAGPGVLDRYARGGSQAISPHVIPNHSLHSVSGTLSILLASRGPNVGVGGGPESLDDAILAAFSLPGAGDSKGVWLVATAWSPEPVADSHGQLTNAPVCHAFALAMQSAAATGTCGELCLRLRTGPRAATEVAPEPLSVAQIVADLERSASHGPESRHTWRLSWEAEAELRLESGAQPTLAAA
jgi:hypothetical protein